MARFGWYNDCTSLSGQLLIKLGTNTYIKQAGIESTLYNKEGELIIKSDPTSIPLEVQVEAMHMEVLSN